MSFMGKDKRAQQPPPDESAPAAAAPEVVAPAAPAAAPAAAQRATHLYETLMGLSCTGPNGYRYLPAGELVEFSPTEAAPLLSAGAIKLAE
jgi:hypothetical protein